MESEPTKVADDEKESFLGSIAGRSETVDLNNGHLIGCDRIIVTCIFAPRWTLWRHIKE